MTLALWDRDFIEGGLQHQLIEHTCVFITLSEPRSARSFAASGAALTAFLKGLHYAVGIRRGTGLSWVGVGELGEQTKHLHWHLLVSGLSYPWCSKLSPSLKTSLLWGSDDDRLARPGALIRDPWGRSGFAVSKNSTVKPLAAENGFGQGFVGLRHVRSSAEDMSAVGGYMSKYLSKGDAGEELPKGFQLVRSSRGANGWWPGHTLQSVRDDNRDRLRAARERPEHRNSQSFAVGALDDSVAEPRLTLFEGGS